MQQVADAVGVSEGGDIWELESALRSANPGLDLLKKIGGALPCHRRLSLSDEAVEPSEASALQFFLGTSTEKLSSEDWEALRSIAERFKGPKK